MLNDGTWMENPNVRLLFYVLAAIMPSIVADVSAERMGWLTVMLVISQAIVAAKAFASDPNAKPTKLEVGVIEHKPVVEVKP
jgi:hypothetical protein